MLLTVNDHPALVTEDHELIACFDDVEAALTAFFDECVDADVLLDRVDAASHDAAGARLTGFEDLVHPRSASHGKSIAG